MSRVGIVSLGCPKALVDSERILSQLKTEGYELVGNGEAADLVIVNTCGFIESAVDESMEAIGEAIDQYGKVVVTGCLGKNAELIRAKHPEVLAVTGPAEYKLVMDAVHQVVAKPRYDPRIDLVPDHGVRLTPPHYAYLKISEGCNHRCSFCIIPQLRGDLASRPIGEVMLEAERLVKAGVQELLVISQDTSAYGVDLKYKLDFWQGRPLKTRFKELVAALGSLGVWVRLHYVYPYPHVDDVLSLMADGKVLPYLDIPFQHAAPRILKLMKRPASAEKVLDRISAWRRQVPDLRLRSTFIVGFPGETDQDFDNLLLFLEDAQLDRVGCFTYSAIEGAAANELPDVIPEELKRERQERLMTLQGMISRERLEQRIGEVDELMIDEVGDDLILGRGRGDAPEVDGRVIITDPRPRALRPGQRIRGRYNEVIDDHDLAAQLL